MGAKSRFTPAARSSRARARATRSTSDVLLRRPSSAGEGQARERRAQRKFCAAFLVDADQNGLASGCAADGRGEREEFVETAEVSWIDRDTGQAAREHGGEFVRQGGSFEADEESLEHLVAFSVIGLQSTILPCLRGCYHARAVAFSSARQRSVAAEREQVKLRIEARAPTRIDLAGGTLDIWPLYLFHPGALTRELRDHALRLLHHRDGAARRHGASRWSRATRGRSESFASLAALERAQRYELPLLAQLVRIFRPRVGLTLTTNSEAPAGAGIGGSSAMAVAICAALDRLTGAGLRREDWIHISRDAEAIVIRVPTGTQDHYPPAFGGAAAICLDPGGERREALACDPRRTREPAGALLHGQAAPIGHQQLGGLPAAHQWRPARVAQPCGDRGGCEEMRAALDRNAWSRSRAVDARRVGVSAAQSADDLHADD